MSKLLTLEAWAQRRYEKPPSMRTLYRWVEAAKIVPLPKKDGRTFYVHPDAEYIDRNDPDYWERLAREPPPSQQG